MKDVLGEVEGKTKNIKVTPGVGNSVPVVRTARHFWRSDGGDRAIDQIEYISNQNKCKNYSQRHP